MELVKSPNKSSQVDTLGSEVLAIHETLLSTLQVCGPMSVEALVERLPQFQWAEVLRAVSQLWGDDKIQLEQYMGQLKIWSLVDYEQQREMGNPKQKMEKKGLELTAL